MLKARLNINERSYKDATESNKVLLATKLYLTPEHLHIHDRHIYRR